MNFITQVSRVVVGILFIFSGLIKLNDPMGFAFKLHDYFAPDVLNLPFLDPWALSLAVFIVIFEVVVGVSLLLGYRVKLTVWLLLLMIVFFTFLTFYSAYFNKVTDCGCFGDAIPLTPWQSFYKDLALLILILILFVGQRHLRPLFNLRIRFGIIFGVLVLCGWIANHVLNHLPFKDFRAYAIGKNIERGMMSAEEIGVEGPIYETFYVLKNVDSDEEMEISGTRYVDEKWWEKKDWEMLSDKTRSVKVKDGYEPPIHDFSISVDGEDITWEVLQSPSYLMIIAYDIDEASLEGLKRTEQLLDAADQAGIPGILMTASLKDRITEVQNAAGTDMPYAITDATTLKTIVRSVPGVVLLKEGTIVGKWHHNDTPSVEELMERLQ
ncbi:MAG: DoxX family membrane protein [Bacteroidota bacterium]|nr:DoxX family membrane protein [Bacteroidota bacterium]